jgi:hypothetical protein
LLVRKILLYFCLLFVLSCANEEIVKEYVYFNTDVNYLTNTKGEIVYDNFVDSDISSSLEFQLVNDINVQDYNNLIVSKSDNHPVYSGERSLRFEIRKGECSSNIFFDDCSNDRSRTEVYEYNRVSIEPGMIQSYDYNMYLVSNEYFNPGSYIDPYSPLTVVSQIYFDDQGIEGDQKGQFYLVVDHEQNLRIRTHTPFTYNIDKEKLIMRDIFDKWITVRMELDTNSNIFRLFLDGNILFQEPYNFIPEYNIEPQYFFKAGVYNSFLSDAKREYKTQVIYYDNLQRFID